MRQFDIFSFKGLSHSCILDWWVDADDEITRLANPQDRQPSVDELIEIQGRLGVGRLGAGQVVVDLRREDQAVDGVEPLLLEVHEGILGRQDHDLREA